jgi:hypothetical protein
MPGQMLKLGPFKGGLNNLSDPTSIKDDEVASCINFDYDSDGTLISRPPIAADTDGPVAAKTVDYLSYYISTTGAVYLVACSNSNLYYKSSGVWTLITSGVTASAAIQYLNKLWVVADEGSTNNGGSWDPVAGWTTIASMPKGSAITTFKERLWIAGGKLSTSNQSRLNFSAIADGTTWNSADFFDINPGDGQALIDIVSVSTNLFLFKQHSTHVMQYDSAPSKAVITPVSRTVGVDDIRCIVNYENVLYVYNDGYLYELINFTYNKINTRISIAANATGSYVRPISVSLVGNRVVVNYYGNIFVFYLFTRTWSQWTVASAIGKFLQTPYSASGSTPYTYVAACNTADNRSTFNFVDGYLAGRSESATATVVSKIYDFNAPNMFKKLYWWGIDILASGSLVATVTPVIYNASVTWAQMAAFTWAEVASYTWNRPAASNVSVSETINTTGAIRKFIKIKKAVRFRNVYFTLAFTISDWQNPIRVYSITPVINMKEQVVKTVN